MMYRPDSLPTLRVSLLGATTILCVITQTLFSRFRMRRRFIFIYFPSFSLCVYWIATPEGSYELFNSVVRSLVDRCDDNEMGANTDSIFAHLRLDNTIPIFSNLVHAKEPCVNPRTPIKTETPLTLSDVDLSQLLLSFSLFLFKSNDSFRQIRFLSFF